MKLQVDEIVALGELTGVHGAEVSFITNVWMSPADRIPVWFRRKGDGRAVVAEVMIRAGQPLQEGTGIHYTALLVQIEADAQAVLEGWILDELDSGRASLLGAHEDPSFEPDLDPERLLVRWRSRTRFLETWEREISKGVLELPDAVQIYAERVHLRLALPDGQTIALPTRLDFAGGEYRLRFRLALPTRQKLRRVARWCEQGLGSARR